MRGRRILSDAQIDQMADMREDGATYAAIAAHFTAAGTAISWQTIAWQCLRLGIIAPNWTQDSVGGGSWGRGRSYTPEEDQQLLELEAQGLSRAAMAKALGRRPNSIAARLYTLARRDAVAEECPAAPTISISDRRKEALLRHRWTQQLQRAREKVARLERMLQS